MPLVKSERARARSLDREDPLRGWRGRFLLPKGRIYLCGNSLGLQPKTAKAYVEQELSDWARLGVEGHHRAKHPWLPYHEFLTDSTARLVGAQKNEVVVMNTLTVNLHLMLTTFYRPTPERFKILIEKDAFPSDRYAVGSHAKLHGYAPDRAIIEARPRAGESAIRPDDLMSLIDREGSSVALILLGNVNYLTGQAFDMAEIARAGHAKGCFAAFDLAHGAGNLDVELHDSQVDFAVWCGYKYLNGGPGALAGCFIHERHATNPSLPRLEGWWGTNKKERFLMKPIFDPIPTAEAWQLSNPPILQLASLRASMEIFDRAGMPALRMKSGKLTAYLESLLKRLPEGVCTIVTPADRGCQLSLRINEDHERLRRRLAAGGVVYDFREPDIIRVAPVPLYNSFEDVYEFARILAEPYGGLD